MSNTVVKLGISSMVALGLIATGAGVAAASPTFTPLPRGEVRVDVPPGERWDCTAMGPSGPQGGPIAGPPRILQLGPGASAFVYCFGNQLPFLHFGTTQAGV